MIKPMCPILLAVFIVAGCDAPPLPPPAPRPVSVLTLAESDPGRFERVTGTVASWKTDRLGFEVDGRVQFVIEPETDIAGQIYDKDGKVLTQGTLLARLDPTRYALAVESAGAQVAVAEKQREATHIEYERVIPAETEAATARRDLAQIEFERNTKLAAQKAAAERAVDLSRSMLRQREAELIQLAASNEAKASEVASIEAKIRELKESEKKAERDLADCRLYSSFAGQIADVHVIPGSVVRQGQPAVTVQMMDPIKVEVEVAAATARRLNHRDQVTVHIPQSGGENLRRLAFIYMIDPVADPQTRTFTVTLMMRNEKVHASMPENLKDQPIARASLVGKVFNKLPRVAEGLFVNEDMLQKDEDGFFLWKILNRRVGALSSSPDSILNVQKVRVTPGDVYLSFLGLASLRDITIADDADFNPDVDMIAGDVTPPEGQTWDSDKLLYDNHRWLVRPGDLVGVDQSASVVQPGIYVPLDAIMEQSGSHFVFAVSESPDGDSARRVEVTVHDSVGTLRRIEAAGDQPLTPATRIVAAGAAFLVDGESINVARQVQLGR